MTSRERCDAYFDGELTPADAADFRTWLQADAANVREFSRHAALHRGLRDELKGHGIRRAESSARNEERSVAPKTSWPRWAVAAAIVIISAFGYSRFVATDPALVVFTARIDKIRGPVMTVDRNGVNRYAAKEREFIAEKSSLEFDGPGRTVVAFFDGTTLDMSAPASGAVLRLNRPEGRPNINRARFGKRVSIENGMLTASVARQPDGQPLIVCTPQAEVTIVGTEFILEAAATATQLTVTQGKVHIVRYLDEASADVSAGESITVNDTEPMRVRRTVKTPVPAH